jgi:hypothetical protein
MLDTTRLGALSDHTASSANIGKVGHVPLTVWSANNLLSQQVRGSGDPCSAPFVCFGMISKYAYNFRSNLITKETQ